MSKLKRIEFGELRIGDIARSHLADVCDSNWASYGPKCKLFETAWGATFGYRHNVAVSSGTDACLNMLLAIRALNPEKAGGEVIVPALSFIATSNAVRAAGYKPVWVDIKAETLNIDETKVEAAITDKTVAIMPVHTMGKPCNMKVLKDIAFRRQLWLLEDCCEAHGAKYQGDYVGLFGHAAAFSFYVAHLVCSGEGGMVSSQHEDIGSALLSTRSHGRKNGDLFFDFPNYGLNSKMNDLEACLGLEGMYNFSETFDDRYANMKIIMQGLAHLKHELMFSEEDLGDINCPHGISMTPRLQHPASGNQVSLAIKDALDRANIHWKRNFGCIPTQHGAFKEYGYNAGYFPNAEYVGSYGIHIGCHQYLEQQDLDRIINTVSNVFK